MRILGIETSCDDTAIALAERHGENVKIIKEVAASQIDVHKIYGGVVPEVAARKHTETIIPLLNEIYDKQNPPDAIAVTSGPGLITSLLVGVETAKTIAKLTNIPLISVNHMEGHIYANWITTCHPGAERSEAIGSHSETDQTPSTVIAKEDDSPTKQSNIEFPILALIVSGGHTELIWMTDHLKYKKIGQTLDDAAGEAFDKIGKLIGLEYPGGPKVSKLATNGNPKAVDLPRPMLDSGDHNFSFSGLKTAAKYYIESDPILSKVTPTSHCEETDRSTRQSIADFCASLEHTIIDVLIHKTLKAARQFNPKTILLGGGVAANSQLRTQLEQAIYSLNCHLDDAGGEILSSNPRDLSHSLKMAELVKFRAPNLAYTTDNASMIAAAGYFKAQKNIYTNPNELRADPAWELPQ